MDLVAECEEVILDSLLGLIPAACCDMTSQKGIRKYRSSEAREDERNTPQLAGGIAHFQVFFLFCEKRLEN